MGLPTEREQLKEWCLRKLGKPVIKINVSDEQADDRIEETLERFHEHHFDGVERTYLKRQVTASTMVFTVALGFAFTKGEEIIGATSGAKGIIFSQADDNLSVQFTTREGTFVINEIINGADAHTATIANTASAITLGDKDNGWIPTDDSIISVIQLVPSGGLLGSGLFSYNYQQALQYLPNFPTGGLSYFYQQKQHMSLIEELFVGDKILRFQRLQNKLYVDINWKDGVEVGEYLIFDAYKAIDAESYKKLYRNYFVREYATTLIKKQWGQNLSKFQGITMLNGTTLNGDQIYERAEKELEVLEKRLQDEFQLPPSMCIG